MNPRHHHRSRSRCLRTNTPTTVPLDVPLSVWLSAKISHLAAELIEELTPPGSLSTMVGLPLPEMPPVAKDRSLVVLSHHSHTHPSSNEIDAPVTINVTSPGKVASHLASMPAAMDLVIASGHWSHGEDFFTACTVALKANGYLAMIATASNTRAHAAMHRRATEAGMRYQHHIAAVHPRELTRATHIVPTTAAEAKRLHARHEDVFIYANRAGGRA